MEKSDWEEICFIYLNSQCLGVKYSQIVAYNLQRIYSRILYYYGGT